MYYISNTVIHLLEKYLIGLAKKSANIFSNRLDCGLKHAAMTTVVRHSGAGRSPVDLDTKLILKTTHVDLY